MRVVDPRSSAFALRAPELLRQFNAAGVLHSADVQVATRIARVGGESDEQVMLAAALAVRGPRIGHVLVDLETIAGTAAVDPEEEVDLSDLPWPEPGEWVARVAASPLVGEMDASPDRPLRLWGSRLYLDRYWRAEAQVAELARAAVPVIAHVSCNPVTFARDARTLAAAGYRLDWVQVVDQFRWSAHVELAARFSRD